MVLAYLGLGSNLGNREWNIAKAIELLSQRIKIELTSSLYETEPVGYLDQPRFLNAVCQVSTGLSPQALLAVAKGIESKLGRRPSFLNAPRTIDVDILFYDERVIDMPELTIPHPRLVERAFVLVPLMEIASHLVHPQNGNTIAELLSAVQGLDGVRKWEKEKK